MNFELIIFYFYALVATLSALAVILVKNPVHSALNLILCFFSVAAIWILLEAEFLGLVLILVYVGAVMVLFLFVLMMLNLNIKELKEGFVQHLPLAILSAGIMLVQTILLFFNIKIKTMPEISSNITNSKQLGTLLYSEYLLQFEIAGVILLVAIIAAIGLTIRKKPKENKYQNPAEQVKSHKKDRLKIVKMKTEDYDG
ncbi:MAG: NADH-quinone oxidoreductase subunit J [Gammaproteobacteria bacterium]|nr:MAG: NADH-quinone oxidoreductase subunit J [Gammaproteobacteria bacterium]